ncbi:MAG TPA: hypothetical protein VGY56_21710 [Verrucomicrobiae bacterium]|nr:hypothetical protein [Verrucomicrobiae bacterium]
MNVETSAALWGAIVGALSGGAVSVGVFFLQDRIKAQRIWDGLELSISPHGGVFVRARVKNNSPYPIRQCWAYISLQYEDDDILDFGSTFIIRSRPCPLIEDRLCWSISGNPASVDICPGESQALNLLDFPAGIEFFWIVSEKNNAPYRVCLRANKSYEGEIKFVSFDMEAKCFPISISLQSEVPVSIHSCYSPV